MSATIYAVTNQKGGVAKTTTALALSTALHLKGYKVLLIDTDPQANASDTYRAKIKGHTTLYDVMCNNINISEAIQRLETSNIVASDILLSSASGNKNFSNIGKEYILKKAIQPIINDYDYIIIDTPPSLDILLANALTASDQLIIPLDADRYSLIGLSQLKETIQLSQEYTNPNLKIAGLLLVKYDDRMILSKDILNDLPEICRLLDTSVFDTKIRQAVALKQAQGKQMSIFEYDSKSKVAKDYLDFTSELLKKENKK